MKHWLCLPLLVLAAPAVAEIPVQRVTVIQALPHDSRAFTQGLFFHRGVLIESTGKVGASDIRKVDLATGKVLSRTPINPEHFGEGSIGWKDQLISLTWQHGIGYRWSFKSLKRAGTFRYPGEGWGLACDGKSLILSDGTATLRYYDPKTFRLNKELAVTADGTPLTRLNELEYVRGEIWANVWMTSYIARISPETGKVTGWVDLSALTAQIGSPDPDAVANGIAYDYKADRLFVTGKYWPWLFEIARP